ncbi:T9SS type A sorting domain-containing protein [Aquimarina algiphila]|uniref:T9SS type A sorting domain-containing protein n=1 Tax=Aquimarina algiphila TaxID=2047982 RepID=UPI0023308FB4|nr:T9SS type A sorting domain-containing protein [Aquimarina algiphila]
MNKSFVWGLLCLALTIAHTGYAQLTCDQRAESILQFEADFPDYPIDLINSLLDDISPCTTPQEGSTASMYTAGILTWLSDDPDKELKGLNLVLSAHSRRYLPATERLLMVYLKGEYSVYDGVDYSKADDICRTMISRNHKPDLARYVAGYINMKHFPTALGSNYTRAKNYFEQSNLPMAKHWLAVMYYFGYGVTQDKTKALQMLTENDIFNSRTLLEYLPTQNSEWLPISAEEHQALYSYAPHFTPKPEKFNGNYNGRFIEFDWSYQGGVKRDIPFTLNLEMESITSSKSNVQYQFDIEGSTIKGTSEMTLSFMKFDSLNFSLQRLYKDHPDKNNVTYEVPQISLGTRTINNDTVLIGQFGGNHRIVEFNESAPPIKIILSKDNSIQSLSTNTLSKSIDQNFAVISPNPIGDRFNLTSDFKENDEIQISVYDMFGNERIVLPPFRSKANREQSIPIDSSTLASGTYLIQIKINGLPFVKTIVKQ